MKTKIQRSPDAEKPAGENKVSHKGYVSQADIDLGDQGKNVSDWWSTGTNATKYPLLYITAPDFALKITAYRNDLTARLQAGGQRPLQTKSLKDLDKQIDDALPQMRIDIASKFGAANRFAAFLQFGFVHKRDQYIFPKDRNDRKESIKLCRDAITANGMTGITYDAAWWTQMLTDYTAALDATNTTDSAVSTTASSKNLLKDEVSQVLQSLRYIITGNHPNDYKQQLRAAGYQKEDQ